MTSTNSPHDYQSIFETRGHHYNSANMLCPTARETERRLLLEALALQKEHVLCDAAAGGGYLAEGAAKILPRSHIICLEPSLAFAHGLDARLARIVGDIERMPLAQGSVDRVSCLAGLHHVSDKSAFVREAHRILKPGGILAAADVQEGTPPALFLNGPCDAYSITGHQGIFFSEGEFTRLLEKEGFRDILERHERYAWTFPDEDTMIEFCTRLFGLMRGTRRQVSEAIHQYLEVEAASGGGVSLHWSLVYARGTRS